YGDVVAALSHDDLATARAQAARIPDASPYRARADRAVADAAAAQPPPPPLVVESKPTKPEDKHAVKPKAVVAPVVPPKVTTTADKKPSYADEMTLVRQEMSAKHYGSVVQHATTAISVRGSIDASEAQMYAALAYCGLQNEPAARSALPRTNPWREN